MDLKVNDYRQKQKKPSKLAAILALAMVFMIPFLLVKHFRPEPQIKPKTNPKIAKKKKTTKTVQINPEVATDTNKESDWKFITTAEGDSIASIFNLLGLSAKQLQQIIADIPHADSIASIKPYQKLQLQINNNELLKLIIPLNPTQSLVIYKEDNKYHSQINTRKLNSHNHYITASVTDNLYNTAKRLDIPYKLIRQMTNIFKDELDFTRDVRKGDQFTIVYEAYYLENKLVGTGDILGVRYTNKRHTYEAIRYKGEDDTTEYYTPDGKSLQKAFTRYPVKYSHISSTFSLARYHPILHKKRPHKGVDLAAPLGTPIHAVGDGKVITIGRDNGYGNLIKIKHNNTYTTVYAHMLKFRKGLSKGDKVKRGQIIGYVGQTGLATGPHCHFELHVNKKPKNPTTTTLPKAEPISPNNIDLFKADALALVGQMKLYEDAYVASKGNLDVGTA